jgi:hypothetical protein
MGATFWTELGGLLGSGFLAYSVLLCGGCLGLHVLAGILHASSRRRYPGVSFAVELVYGLVHPILYLLILEPAFFRHVTDPRIQAVSWTLLFLYWAFRLGGAALPLSDGSLRRIGRWICALCGLWVATLGIRDGVAGSLTPTENNFGPVVQVLLCSPLYLVPLWIAFSHWRAARSSSGWSSSKLLVFPGQTVRRWVACGVVVAIGFVSLASVHLPAAIVREDVLRNGDAILAAGQKHRIDPRLIAALYFITQRDTTTPFRARLEQTAAGAWLVDLKSHFGLAAALDPSLGATQIKPVTLITARVIRRKSDDPDGYYNKQEREVPEAGDAWTRLPSPSLKSVPFDPWIQQREKAGLVKALLPPARNIEACAFLLDLYATQWEAANPAWSIRDRPEILATLFQIGFQHSYPKPDPRPNDFGQAVAEAMHEPWIQSRFGPSGR